MNKKGQVTIFVIIGILVVVAGILIYQFVPGLKSTKVDFEENPEIYIQNCIEETLINNIETISRNGGSFENEHPYMYQGVAIDYLCYTPKYYEFCMVEKPLLISHFEKEIKNSINDKLNECFDTMVTSFENKGYTTNLRKGNYEVRILNEKISININNSLTLSKTETVNYDSFSIVLNKNLYEVLSISYNILNWEAAYGDSDVDLYMDFNPNIRIDKIKRDDGTKIYVVKNIDDKGDTYFQFASRSLVSPPGTGAKQIAVQEGYI